MILVTGGGGFIGSHLVHQLVEVGEEVRVLEGRGAEVRHLPLDAIQLVRGDIRCEQEVRDAMAEGMKAVEAAVRIRRTARS